jgi:hypothetical protein
MCPICSDPTCPGNGYQFMWERFAAGRNVDHWRLIHDRLNGLAPMNPPQPRQPADDEALRAYMAQHGCGGC